MDINNVDTVNTFEVIKSKIRILSDDMAQVKAVVEVVGTIGDKLFSDEIKVYVNSLYLTTKQRDDMIKLKAIEEFKEIYANYANYSDKETSPPRSYTMKYMRQQPIIYSIKDE